MLLRVRSDFSLGFHLQNRCRDNGNVNVVLFIKSHLELALSGSTESNHGHTFRIAS